MEVGVLVVIVCLWGRDGQLSSAANCGSLLLLFTCRFCVESLVSCVLYLTFFLGMSFVWMDPLSSFFRRNNQQVKVLEACMSGNFSTPVP